MNKNTVSILVIVAIVLFFSLIDENDGFKRDSSGSIVSGGNIPSADLRVGDCFNDLDPEAIKRLLEENEEEGEFSAEINYVEALPCGMPHTNEVYANSVTLFDEFDSYPSEEDLDDKVWSLCLPGGFKYLGIDGLDTTEEEKFLLTRAEFPDFYMYIFPKKLSWDTGYRKISCVLYTELPRNKSARNSLIEN